MLAFQRVRPRLIWSPGTPDTNENLRRGQAATPVGSFGQVDKTAKFSRIKGKICFLSLHKVCLDLQKKKKKNKTVIKIEFMMSRQMGRKCKRIMMRNESEKEKIDKREMNIIAIFAVVL